jgi:uncharacterized membrane protein YdjX (TVP38/TMEM64 family)
MFKLNSLKNFLIPISILSILIVLQLTGLSSEIAKIIFLLPDRYDSYGLKIIISIIIYVVGASTVVPVTILNYFIGLVFGYPIGIFLALLFNALSCILAYWIFKYLNTKLRKDSLRELKTSNKNKFFEVNLLQKNPTTKIAYACLILPFSVIVSAITSLDNISFKPYIIGMLLGTAPSCLVYSFFGTLNMKTNPFSVVVISILVVFLITLPVTFKSIYSHSKNHKRK